MRHRIHSTTPCTDQARLAISVNHVEVCTTSQSAVVNGSMVKLGTASGKLSRWSLCRASDGAKVRRGADGATGASSATVGIWLMIDKVLRIPKEQLLTPLAVRLPEVLHPSVVTGAAFVAGLGASVAAAQQWYGWSIALWILNRVLDGLDGTLAREHWAWPCNLKQRIVRSH